MYSDLQERLDSLKKSPPVDVLAQLGKVKTAVRERKLNYPYFKPFQSELVASLEQQVQQMVGVLVG